MALSVYTVGHGRHPVERFLELLEAYEVEVLVDARSQPFSRWSPHFSKKALAQAVVQAGRRYLWMGDTIGGRPPWPEHYGPDGRIDYDRVEADPRYQAGIARLLEGIARFRVCLLCAEEDPEHCHRRRLVSRTLLRRGVEVIHIRGTGAHEREPAEQLELLPPPGRR